MTPANTSRFDSLTEQLEHGAQTYDLHCATCHGDTGLGFAEAKLAFLEDHPPPMSLLPPPPQPATEASGQYDLAQRV